MPGYFQKALIQFQHIRKGKKQNSPFPYTAPEYRKKQQRTKIDTTEPMTATEKKSLQGVTGKFLYYRRAVDNTMLHALICLATRVNNGTQQTMKALHHFLY